VTADQAKIAEEAGACAVMALERVPSDIRAAGGVARMADPTKIVEIICEHPVAALGVVFVEFTQHTDQMFFFDLACRARRFHPLVVGLLTEAQHPARHRDWHPHPGTRVVPRRVV